MKSAAAAFRLRGICNSSGSGALNKNFIFKWERLQLTGFLQKGLIPYVWIFPHCHIGSHTEWPSFLIGVPNFSRGALQGLRAHHPARRHGDRA